MRSPSGEHHRSRCSFYITHRIIRISPHSAGIPVEGIPHSPSLNRMTRRTLDRRSFVRTTAALGVTTALAGRWRQRRRRGATAPTGATAPAAPAAPAATAAARFLSEEPDYGGFLDDANNYEQTVDMTGSDSVTVEVGAGEGWRSVPRRSQCRPERPLLGSGRVKAAATTCPGPTGISKARPSARRAIPSSTRSRNPAPIRTSVRRMRRSA